MNLLNKILQDKNIGSSNQKFNYINIATTNSAVMKRNNEFYLSDIEEGDFYTIENKSPIKLGEMLTCVLLNYTYVYEENKKDGDTVIHNFDGSAIWDDFKKSLILRVGDNFVPVKRISYLLVANLTNHKELVPYAIKIKGGSANNFKDFLSQFKTKRLEPLGCFFELTSEFVEGENHDYYAFKFNVTSKIEDVVLLNNVQNMALKYNNEYEVLPAVEGDINLTKIERQV